MNNSLNNQNTQPQANYDPNTGQPLTQQPQTAQPVQQPQANFDPNTGQPITQQSQQAQPAPQPQPEEKVIDVDTKVKDGQYKCPNCGSSQIEPNPKTGKLNRKKRYG